MPVKHKLNFGDSSDAQPPILEKIISEYQNLYAAHLGGSTIDVHFNDHGRIEKSIDLDFAFSTTFKGTEAPISGALNVSPHYVGYNLIDKLSNKKYS